MKIAITGINGVIGKVLNEKFKNKYRFKLYNRDEISIINWKKHLTIYN